MLLKEVKPQKLLMWNQMDDEYPRRPRKFHKHLLKGEDRKNILREWIKFQKTGANPLIDA